jgi:hypothetical protein
LAFFLFIHFFTCVFFSFHLHDLTRTHLGFACTLHIHDTPAIIYISLLSHIKNLFSPVSTWPDLGRGVWRCLARVSRRAEECRRALDFIPPARTSCS